MLKLTVIDAFNEIKKDDWDGLFDRTRNSYIFQSYGFQSSWWKAFGENSHDRGLMIIQLKENGRLIALAPLMMEKTAFFSKSVIKYTGTPICDYMDFLIEKGRENEASQIIVDFIRKQKCLEAGLLYSTKTASVWQNSSVLRNYKEAAPGIRLKYFSENNSDIPDKKCKKDLLRCQRNIEKHGTLIFEQVNDKALIDTFLDSYFNIHVKCWKEHRKKYSQFQFKNWRMFVTNVCYELFDKGWIDLSCLKLNGKIIAGHFGFVFSGRFYYYMPAFDPDFSRYSPSRLLIKYLIEYYANRGLDYFDFLRGEEPYKIPWSNEKTELYEFIICPDNKILKYYGNLYRFGKNFYESYFKINLKKIKPLMHIWHRTKHD